MTRFEDPADELNGPLYHTGKKCIEPDCTHKAGTAWSPYWCYECNVARMKRIDKSMLEHAGNGMSLEHQIERLTAAVGQLS